MPQPIQESVPTDVDDDLSNANDVEIEMTLIDSDYASMVAVAGWSSPEYATFVHGHWSYWWSTQYVIQCVKQSLSINKERIVTFNQIHLWFVMVTQHAKPTNLEIPAMALIE